MGGKNEMIKISNHPTPLRNNGGYSVMALTADKLRNTQSFPQIPDAR